MLSPARKLLLFVILAAAFLPALATSTAPPAGAQTFAPATKTYGLGTPDCSKQSTASKLFNPFKADCYPRQAGGAAVDAGAKVVQNKILKMVFVVIGWFAVQPIHFAIWILGLAIHEIAQPSKDLFVGGFTEMYKNMMYIAFTLTIPLFFISIIQGIAKWSTPHVLRSVVMVPISMVGGFAGIFVVQKLVQVDNQWGLFIGKDMAHNTGEFLHGLQTAMGGFATLTVGSAIPVELIFSLVTAIFIIFTGMGIVFELLFRDVAVQIATFFLPLGFAAIVWPATARWLRRMVELVVALIFSKFVIIAILGLGAMLLAGTKAQLTRPDGTVVNPNGAVARPVGGSSGGGPSFFSAPATLGQTVEQCDQDPTLEGCTRGNSAPGTSDNPGPGAGVGDPAAQNTDPNCTPSTCASPANDEITTDGQTLTSGYENDTAPQEKDMAGIKSVIEGMVLLFLAAVAPVKLLSFLPHAEAAVAAGLGNLKRDAHAQSRLPSKGSATGMSNTVFTIGGFLTARKNRADMKAQNDIAMAGGAKPSRGGPGGGPPGVGSGGGPGGGLGGGPGRPPIGGGNGGAGSTRTGSSTTGGFTPTPKSPAGVGGGSGGGAGAAVPGAVSSGASKGTLAIAGGAAAGAAAGGAGKGERGPAGPTGLTGAKGSTGGDGRKGSQGMQGFRGLSNNSAPISSTGNGSTGGYKGVVTGKGKG